MNVIGFMSDRAARPLTQEDLTSLPGEWLALEFEGCLAADAGRIGKVQRSAYLSRGRYPVVDQGQQLVAGYWDQPEDVYRGALPVIVFGDHTRALKYVATPFVAGADGVRVLAPNTERYHPAFLYYALLMTDVPSRGYNRHYSLLREARLPCPPLAEQRAIAHVLRTVQDAIEATERVIAATKELKRSLMRHLFTYGRVPVQEVDRVPLKETEIGPVPEHWEVVRIGDLARSGRLTIDPQQYPNELFDYYSIPAYQVGDAPVLERGGRIKSQKTVVDAGTVLFGKLNPRVPKVWLVKEPSERRKIASTEFVPLAPIRDRCSEDYLYQLCWSRYVMPVSQTLVSGSTPSRQRVDVSAFLDLLVPLPPLSEQLLIAEALSAADGYLRVGRARASVLRTLFDSLLHNLMTGKVRVDEFASSEPQEVS